MITYKSSTTFSLVKTGFEILYRLFGSQKYFAKFLQTLNKLCGKERGFVKHLQAFNWLCSCENVLTEHLQLFNRLCGSQNVRHHSPQAWHHNPVQAGL